MTNASALTALQSLNTTNKNLEMTQSRISTGYRVATASDNAAYWSIATTMRSDKSSLSAVQDALGLGAAKVDTAYTAMRRRSPGSTRSRTSWLPATSASADDKAKIQTEITALQAQLKMGADGATFSGSNWLSLNTTTGNRRRPASPTSPRSLRPSPAARPARSRCRPSTSTSRASSSTKPTQRATAVQKGILDGLRLGTSGARDITATVAVAGTGRRHRRLRRRRR